MDRMVNNNWLAWILICMLRTYKTHNSIVEFLKYEFNKKLLSGITLLRVTLDVTWTHPLWGYPMYQIYASTYLQLVCRSHYHHRLWETNCISLKYNILFLTTCQIVEGKQGWSHSY